MPPARPYRVGLVNEDLAALEKALDDVTLRRKFLKRAHLQDFVPPPTRRVRGSRDPMTSIVNTTQFAVRRGLLEANWLVLDADDERSVENDKRRLTVLSKVLSYPLTLLGNWHRVVPRARQLELMRPTEFGGRSGVVKPLRVDVIGARAEATLPARFWRECTQVFGATPVELGFFGPEIPQQMNGTELAMTSEIVARDDGDDDDEVKGGEGADKNENAKKTTPEDVEKKTKTDRLRFYSTNFPPPAAKNTSLPDLFVLYNPGLSTEYAGNQWRGFFDFLATLPGPAPGILVTSLSPLEHANDMRDERGIMSEFLNRKNMKKVDISNANGFYSSWPVTVPSSLSSNSPAVVHANRGVWGITSSQ